MLLKFALKDYIDEKKFQNLSERSIQSYKATLKEFSTFCLEREVVDLEDVDARLVKKYLMQCQSNGNLPSTINHKMRNIKVFFSYCCKEEIIDEKRNPTLKISYVKEEEKIICFTEYHVNQMLNYYRRIKNREKTYFVYRDYVIILILLSTGIRLGELCNLKWIDVDIENSKITVIGKVRKQRTIPIVDKLKRELLEYKYFKEKHFNSSEKETYVFTNISNRRLTENAVQNVFKRLKTAMNFKDVRVSCHTFRHTFAKNWIMSGGDIFSLQSILGHSKLDMVKKYADLFNSAIKVQNDKYNPLSNMKLE